MARIPDQEKLDQWLFELEKPFPWEAKEAVRAADVEQDSALFMQAMGQLGG